jgi:hypothetical protein
MRAPTLASDGVVRDGAARDGVPREGMIRDGVGTLGSVRPGATGRLRAAHSRASQ